MSCVKSISYLFVIGAFVCVVQLVGEDLSVASDGFVPAERGRRWCVRHRLQVRSGARHLYWKNETYIKQEIRKSSNLTFFFSNHKPYGQHFLACLEKVTCISFLRLIMKIFLLMWFKKKEEENVLQQKRNEIIIHLAFVHSLPLTSIQWGSHFIVLHHISQKWDKVCNTMALIILIILFASLYILLCIFNASSTPGCNAFILCKALWIILYMKCATQMNLTWLGFKAK